MIQHFISKEMKTGSLRDTCASVFITALFTRAKIYGRNLSVYSVVASTQKKKKLINNLIKTLERKGSAAQEPTVTFTLQGAQGLRYQGLPAGQASAWSFEHGWVGFC